MLTECLDSIHAQTLQPDDIVVGIDPYRLGEVGNGNRLIDATDSEWIAFCHSDDLWKPNHLKVCMEHQDADVIVSRFDLVNRPWSTIEPWHENFEDLRRTNWIGSPSMVVVRREVFGHWVQPEQPPPRDWNDWCNWRRLLDAGAKFADTRKVTVLYRFFGDNGSWHG